MIEDGMKLLHSDGLVECYVCRSFYSNRSISS